LYWNQLGNRVVEGDRGVQTNVTNPESVLLWPLDPESGSGIGKKGSGINNPDHSWIKYLNSSLDPYPGPGAFFTLDRMEKSGSGINIADPQQWCNLLRTLPKQFLFS
jgi:hypothetical protein